MARQTSVVVVNWNGSRYFRQLLPSLLQEKPLEVFVVDNASDDPSLEVLCEFPGVKVIANKTNVGFGAGANQGIKQARGEFVLVMNVDMEVQPRSLDVLEEFLRQNPSVGIAAPQLVNPDGTLQRSCRSFPTILRLFLYLSFLDRIFPSDYILSEAKHSRIREVDQPMGAALMIRRSLLESVSSFDERFFMYMEEVDLCDRVKKAGWKVVYNPESKMIHLGGGSTSQAWERSQQNYFQSVLLYFQKRTPSRMFPLRSAMSLALLIRIFVFLFSGNLFRARVYMKILFGIVWSNPGLK